VPAIAAIVHDPALLDDAEQIRAAGAVAALALENERLEAELRAKVEQLSASTSRATRRAGASSGICTTATSSVSCPSASASESSAREWRAIVMLFERI
jgi:hypothetical protein